MALVLIVLFSGFWFYYLKDERENRLTRKGNELVEKVEYFKRINGRLPKTLDEINVKMEEGLDELYYTPYNENYTISFSMSIDYNKTFYSDSKKWENSFRELK